MSLCASCPLFPGDAVIAAAKETRSSLELVLEVLKPDDHYLAMNSKFWDLRVQGTKTIVNKSSSVAFTLTLFKLTYGVRGKRGKQNTIEHGSNEDAIAYTNKAILRKRREGYKPVKHPKYVELEKLLASQKETTTFKETHEPAQKKARIDSGSSYAKGFVSYSPR